MLGRLDAELALAFPDAAAATEPMLACMRALHSAHVQSVAAVERGGRSARMGRRSI